jgi:formiminotetrahydrofolate cyclodeaminase
MLADQSVRALLEAFASSDPTPGGGSAAALAGALGASLLAMVAGMPKTKTGTPEDRAALDAARAKLVSLREVLIQLIDRDAQAYDLVVAAYRRPKGTDTEKAARASAIQEALRTATIVPLETYRACTDAMEAAATVAERGNPSAVSDVIVGFSALGLGMQGAAANVEINLESVTDAPWIESIDQELRGRAVRLREAARQMYSAGPVLDFMKKMAQRSGTLHGAPPYEPGTPEFRSAAARAATGALARLDVPEARQALDLLASSDDPVVAQPAREALNRPHPSS